MLRVRHLLINVLAEKGKYGAELDFSDGLNVIRADNSMGKSTLMQAIIYSLGLEGMFGPSQEVPLAHVVTDYLEEDSTKTNVMESEVYLEIENAAGQYLTVQRTIKGSRNRHLVTAFDGRAVTAHEGLGTRRDYFVREPYAAVSEKGFHRALAEFIGWQLPSVPRFNDVDCPLYLETVFPLLFVEQKLGWGKIPARYPTWLGVRDIARRTVEFLLGLDAYKIAIEKAAVQDGIARIRAEWGTLRTHTARLAMSGAGIVDGIPGDPVATWPPEVPPRLLISHRQTWVPLRNQLEELRHRLATLEREAVPRAAEVAPKVNADLKENEVRLADMEGEVARLAEQLESDRSEALALEARLGTLRDDLRKHKDLRRLTRLGSTDQAPLTDGLCPVCHQELPGSLLDTGRRAVPMSVDQNIEFLEEQVQLFEAVLANARETIETNEIRIQAHRSAIDNVRQRIRFLRETATSPGSAPSVDAIAERIHVDQRIRDLERLGTAVEDALAEFAQLADEWKQVQERRVRLPKGALSSNDDNKVRHLEESVRKQLRSYGMDSLQPEAVAISRGNYEPEVAGLNLGADVSASDLIRLQWAYLLGLLETGLGFETNHPGVLVMDEPQQQSVEDKDFQEMLRYAASFRKAQIIVATSHEPSTLLRFLDGIGAGKVHNVAGRTIARI